MSKKNSAYLSIMLVTAFMGLMLATQFRVANRAQGGIPTDRAKEMMTQLKQVEHEKESLNKEINDLEYKLDQLNQGKSEAFKALVGELDKTRMVSGRVTVTGPGVEVIMDNPVTGGKAAPELSFIQDQDLFTMVNELWGSGAEAVSINGQRVTATTEIRYAAPFINVNTTRVVPPFQVLAIGDPVALANALELPGGLIEYYRDIGFQVTVEQHQDLTISAFTQR